MPDKNQMNDNSARELCITATLNAPVEMAWNVFTKPEHIQHWWGPAGFTNTISTMEVKPGGNWEFIMHGPDGTDYKNKSVFEEIIKQERIVFKHITGPKYTATIIFTDAGIKTNIEWHMLFETAEQFQQVIKVFKADEGLKQNIVRLQEYLDSVIK
jgi:uncharacterized protein YndB with AHSA1/START domain